MNIILETYDKQNKSRSHNAGMQINKYKIEPYLSIYSHTNQ
jgi:hypothetical protein